MQIDITDNSGLVKEELGAACLRALETCGPAAAGYAKNQCPADTGGLRSSITHRVQPDEQAVYIGTNSECAADVELGGGKYAPGNRQARPYLKPAVAGHAAQYRGIIQGELKNG